MKKQNLVNKRAKERSIIEAKQKVDQWRHFFINGEIDENGNKIKYSLQKAADKVGIPRKSLEDYRFLFRKAQSFIDLKQVSDKRMGYLRFLIKQQQLKQQYQQSHLESLISQKEKSKILKPDNNIFIEDMIVEGQTNRQNWDQELSEYFDYAQNEKVSLKQQERNFKKNFEIPNTHLDQQVFHEFQIE
ncbi:unnamed protein product [Paramecium sonneborni]|uniref:Uncharacterized protein n=1 Tax=Paramecium sonneborni TaxID=65129 RepID=A0A8S1MG03_9CILI|nr:unnamed protein product [Paramecium sonneborni]CAD8077301.1 unnamed protein product [Paramecium sonneborni]